MGDYPKNDPSITDEAEGKEMNPELSKRILQLQSIIADFHERKNSVNQDGQPVLRSFEDYLGSYAYNFIEYNNKSKTQEHVVDAESSTKAYTLYLDDGMKRMWPFAELEDQEEVWSKFSHNLGQPASFYSDRFDVLTPDPTYKGFAIGILKIHAINSSSQGFYKSALDVYKLLNDEEKIAELSKKPVYDSTIKENMDYKPVFDAFKAFYAEYKNMHKLSTEERRALLDEIEVAAKMKLMELTAI